MIQTNLQTQKTRQIQLKQPIQTTPNTYKLRSFQTNFWIRGLLGDIDQILQALQEELDNQDSHDELKIPPNLISGLKPMINKLNKPPQLKVSYENGILIFTGNQHLIKVAKLEIMNSIDLNYSQYQIQYPNGFEGNDTLQFLNSNSEEYQQAAQQFLSSIKLPSVRIVKIEKIINKNLYKRDKLGKENCQYLFHGTRSNHPSIIYKGADEAFDMRLANEGLWGKGIYFAKLASYSDSYSYVDNKTQIRQMFLAEVNLGASIKLNQDGSLKRPPEKNKSGQRYDSVEGFTGNSVVFIVYDNSKAYPSYLISYKI